ncbi:DNA mismatch repair endonuclease MutL [Bartonella sp. DGB1]|uniref:DNA mismatch repair endonuclease MutL n=1 Tax=Bartonella sp. DGB1 TaxID=3239807 RepID=UPI003526B251
MNIRQLPDNIINQIAAGEVIERPANVLKELLENSIDSGATNIDILIEHGGKSLIKVIDNGCGISCNELPLAISRHCTSKMSSNLSEINTLGFRGEALPSIGSVANLTVISRTIESETAFKITVNGGKVSTPVPIAGLVGTTVEVSNLFYTTPARLKFMKSDTAEANAIVDLVKRTAIAFPDIKITLSGIQKKPFIFPAINSNSANPYLERIGQILGDEFTQNSLELQSERDNFHLSAFISIPTYNRSNNLWQYIYVNGRPVRDKVILTAIRVAYMDHIAYDRHAVVVLFLQAPTSHVDINVHPTKSDVRFADSNFIRSFIISAIRDRLANMPIISATSNKKNLMNFFQEPKENLKNFIVDKYYQANHEKNFNNYSSSSSSPPLVTKNQSELPLSTSNIYPTTINPSADTRTNEYDWNAEIYDYPLGAAKAQIHKNYIISQTKDGIILIDQHAAHERLIYEKLKQALYAKPIAQQLLLIPEIITLDEIKVKFLLEYATNLEKMGLVIEAFGEDTIIVRATPAILPKLDVRKLIMEILDDCLSKDTSNNLERKIDYVVATIACHGSIRSGRILKPEEMNQLLRDIESTPAAATCNHGRPTYVELKLTDIEKLFKRR